MVHLTGDLEQLVNYSNDERIRALERIIPRQIVQEVLRKTGHSRRHYKLLPGWFMVWFVIGLGLFATDCYSQVFKFFRRFRKGRSPSRGALGEARKGLGVAPMRLSLRPYRPLVGQAPDPRCFLQGHAFDGPRWLRRRFARHS